MNDRCDGNVISAVELMKTIGKLFPPTINVYLDVINLSGLKWLSFDYFVIAKSVNKLYGTESLKTGQRR